MILFVFMEQGICSLRELEKLCHNDIRFMYLLDGMKAPSFATLRAMAEEVVLREIVYELRRKLIYGDVNNNG